MTLIGPKPQMPEEPLFPTPWISDASVIRDADGEPVEFFGEPELAAKVVSIVNEWAENFGPAVPLVEDLMTPFVDADGDTWKYQAGDQRWHCMQPGTSISYSTRDTIRDNFGESAH